jgi:Ca2+-binding EF-hand superfamily protein
MKALQVPLDDTELVALFQHIDKLQRGTIDYQGFVQEFPEINSKRSNFI